jgi:hypothetical protein
MRRSKIARYSIAPGGTIKPRRPVAADVDGRSIIARRYRDIAHAIQIEQGDEISEARLQLIRRFAANRRQVRPCPLCPRKRQ